MPAPRVIVKTRPAGVPVDREVVFDFDRLVAIEEATGLTIQAVCDELAGYMPRKGGDQPATEDELRAAGDRFNLRFVRSFLAGCLGVAPTEVGGFIPMDQVKGSFAKLVVGFFMAMFELSGKEEGAASTEGPSQGQAEASPA